MIKQHSEKAAKVIKHPEDMFIDMVRRAGGDLVNATCNCKCLRVATMCSGTEAPLVALDFIRNALKVVHGIDMEIEHVFSCEIEPFKQAYIEVNFAPKKLFRDIRELAAGFATTNYGSIVEVPSDVDILIAGTSCVDNSTLNRYPKDGRDGGGESAQTYQAMMAWIKKSRTSPKCSTMPTSFDKTITKHMKMKSNFPSDDSHSP